MKHIIVSLFLILLTGTYSKALERFDLVTTEELFELLQERIEGKNNFFLVNTLDTLIFNHHYIPGSVNIPWSKVDELSHLLPQDPNTLVVTYCMGYRWVFAYKAAVAVKKLGYTHIKIYNGGIKDWRKSGFPLESRELLPQSEIANISTDTLFASLSEYDKQGCTDNTEKALLTLLDFRNANYLHSENPPPQIATKCPVQQYLLDDILAEEVRRKIPTEGTVVTITETGNRDELIIRYLSQHGFTNIKALKFGMRGWLKKRYPTTK